MRILNTAVQAVRRLPVLGKLSLAALALAVMMNFYLFAYDNDHSSDPLMLTLNHLLSIWIWFVVFTFIVFMAFGIFQLVAQLCNAIRSRRS